MCPTNLQEDVSDQLTSLLACPQVAGSSWSIPALAAGPISIACTTVLSLAPSETAVSGVPEGEGRSHLVIIVSHLFESSALRCLWDKAAISQVA